MNEENARINLLFKAALEFNARVIAYAAEVFTSDSRRTLTSRHVHKQLLDIFQDYAAKTKTILEAKE